MINNGELQIKEGILLCMENVGIDSNLVIDEKEKNVLSLMDSLQYISFIAEIENYLEVVLTNDFLSVDSFESLNDFIIKLEYYVKGWRESFRNKLNMKEGEEDKT